VHERRPRHGSPTAVSGNRPVDRVYLRSTPVIDAFWISTFNLRWWEHVQHEPDMVSPRAEQADGRAKVKSTA
jgi:hypothetical protein